jgi:hypothetical protein
VRACQESVYVAPVDRVYDLPHPFSLPHARSLAHDRLELAWVGLSERGPGPSAKRVPEEMRIRPRSPYNPIPLPRISFMSPERGTGDHAGSSEDTNPLQLRLFEAEGNDQP